MINIDVFINLLINNTLTRFDILYDYTCFYNNINFFLNYPSFM